MRATSEEAEATTGFQGVVWSWGDTRTVVPQTGATGQRLSSPEKKAEGGADLGRRVAESWSNGLGSMREKKLKDWGGRGTCSGIWIGPPTWVCSAEGGEAGLGAPGVADHPRVLGPTPRRPLELAGCSTRSSEGWRKNRAFWVDC